MGRGRRQATAGNGSTLGFLADSPEAVDAWHAAGLAHGGRAIEDPPGIRHATGGRRMYLAYLWDPSGNKLCAAHRLAQAAVAAAGAPGHS